MNRRITRPRKIIVNLAMSADGFIARPDGDLEWLTSRPAPKGFYGMGEFVQSIDTKLIGRKTFDVSVRLGARFESKTRYYVFTRQPPASAPPGVDFVSGGIASFVKTLKAQKGKDIWMMGGGGLIASFLDESAIDEFLISVVPVFIGEGIPLLAPRHRHVPLQLRSATPFPDGVVQLHYVLDQLPLSSNVGGRASTPTSRLS